MKTVLLVGHCNFDGPKLKKLVESVCEVDVKIIDSQKEFLDYVEAKNNFDLALVNRQFAFTGESGLEVIKEAKAIDKNCKVMLISNYSDAQSEAVKLGAMKGFGKDSLTSSETKDLLEEALN